MMNTPLLQAPYLREQRQFPNDDLRELSNQVDHAYIDIATKVNLRTISVFPVNNPVINGESWYLTGQPNRQQALRQVYAFTSFANVPHGINTTTVTQFTKCYGSYIGTDGNFYGILFSNSTAIAGQVSFFIQSTANGGNIVILTGAGFIPIDTTKGGIIVLEWISQF